MAEKIEILLTADDQASSKVGGLKAALGDVAKIAGGFVVGAAMTQLPGLLSGAASQAVSLEQNARKAAVVFGDSLGTVEAWADASASGMGLTSREATTLATNMADLLKPMGFTAEAAATMSTQTLDLAGALAEWSGGTKSAAEVSDLLTAAMLGETDGLKALGISLSADEIARRAATLTGQEYANMTEAQKEALATQQLILEKSTDAQVAYANSQDDTASRQARATAEMALAKEQLSLALLPAVQLGTTAFALLATLLATTLVPGLIGIGEGIAGFLAHLSPAVTFVQANAVPILAGLGTGLTVLAVAAIPALISAIMAKVVALYHMVAAWIAANTAMLPVIATALAIAAAVALLVAAWQGNWFGIQDKTKAVIDFLAPYIQGFWDGIQRAVETVWPIISAIVTTYITILKTEIELALAAVQAIWGVVWPAIQLVVETVFPIIATVVGTYIGIVQAVIETALGIIQTVWSTAWSAVSLVIDTVFVPVAGVIDTTISGARDTLSRVLGEIQGAWDTVWGAVKGTVDTIWNGANGIGRLVAGGVAGIKTTIDNAIGGITGAWQGMWDTITGAVSTAVGSIRGFVNSIIGAINGLIGAWNGLEFTFPGYDGPGGLDVPGFSVGTPDVPLIPALAAGGIVTRPTLALVGEAGPEAVVPLTERTFDRLAAGIAARGGGGRPVSITINTASDRPAGIANALRVTLRALALDPALSGVV